LRRLLSPFEEQQPVTSSEHKAHWFIWTRGIDPVTGHPHEFGRCKICGATKERKCWRCEPELDSSEGDWKAVAAMNRARLGITGTEKAAVTR
jgi:hypothetical protein